MNIHLVKALADDLHKASIEMQDDEGNWTWFDLADYLESVGWTNG